MTNKLLLKPEEALELLEVNGDDTVHTQYNNAPGLFIGADRSLESLKNLFHSSECIEIGGPNCVAMGHGVVVWESERSPLFVAHNEEKLRAKYPEAYETE